MDVGFSDVGSLDDAAGDDDAGPDSVQAKPDAAVVAAPEVSVEPEPEVSVEPEPEVGVEPEPEVGVEPEPEVAVEPEPEVSAEVVDDVTDAGPDDVSPDTEEEVVEPACTDEECALAPDQCGVGWCDPVEGCQTDCFPGCGGCASDPDCDPGDPCVIGACEVTDGPCPSSQCVHVSKCNDGKVCTVDSCDPSTGECVHEPLDCDDGDICTLDDCTSDEGCTYEIIIQGCEGCQFDFECEDETNCTVDTCVLAPGDFDGECQHEPFICDDEEPCTADECNPALPGGGKCVFVDVVCEDDDVCTDDSCDAETGECLHTDVGCEAGLTCDPVDGCPEPVCTQDDCPTDIACGVSTCDPAVGCEVECFPGCGGCFSNPDCDDGDICTVDVCDTLPGPCGATACSSVPFPCPDGDGDPCVVGTCSPDDGCVLLEVCDDGDPCTADICDPVTLACSFVPTDCDDGEPCTLNDQCVDGDCVAGELLNCAVGECPLPTCDPLAGACSPAPADPSVHFGDFFVGDATNAATLANTTAITGSFRFSGGTTATDVSAPNLKCVGLDLFMLDGDVQHLDLPGLITVGRDIYFNQGLELETLDIHNLRGNVGLLFFSGNAKLESVSVPGLRHVTKPPGIIASVNAAITRFDFSGIETVAGTLDVSDNGQLRDLELTSLHTISESVQVLDNPELTALSLPALDGSIDDVDIQGNAKAAILSLPLVDTITGDVEVRDNTAALTLDLGSVTTLQGHFQVTGNTALQAITLGNLTGTFAGILTLEHMPALQAFDLPNITTAAIWIQIDDLPSLASLDFSSLQGIAQFLKIHGTGLQSLQFPLLQSLSGPGQIGLSLSGNADLPSACGDALHAQMQSASGYNGPYTNEGGAPGPCP